MRSREDFDRIRAQKKELFTLRVRMTLMVQAELILCVGLSFAVHWALHSLWPLLNIPLWLEILAVSMIVGLILTGFVSKHFFGPIKNLRNAMEKVADGDFTARLETSPYSSKEIQEIYAGFNLMTHELNSTEILQSDFASNVSHEFKTPINAIEGYATLLQDTEGLSDEERAEYVDKIIYNTKRLSGLVGNILLLSKIDNQSIPKKQESFRLDEQIRASIMLLEPEWIKKDIDFDVEMDEITIVGNESLLHHVWDNLISNAVKFNPQNGMIRIKLIKKDSKVIFTIDDNGPGISDSAKKHIFDKFYQADSSHKEEGNGLGLALVKQILKLSGGTVSADNIPGGGCRFTVILNI